MASRSATAAAYGNSKQRQSYGKGKTGINKERPKFPAKKAGVRDQKDGKRSPLAAKKGK